MVFSMDNPFFFFFLSLSFSQVWREPLEGESCTATGVWVTDRHDYSSVRAGKHVKHRPIDFHVI